MQTVPGTDPWQTNFGAESPFALGVEEELLLVDADNALAESSAAVRSEADPDEGDVTSELYRAMVENRSDVTMSAADAVAQLRGLRRALTETGTRVMAVGVHPAARPGSAAFEMPRATPRSRTRSRASFARRSAASTSTWECLTPRRPCAHTTGSASTSRC